MENNKTENGKTNSATNNVEPTVNNAEKNTAAKPLLPTPEEWTEWSNKFETLLKEAENYKDLYLRARAELENYKKRLPREREEMRFQLLTLIFDPILSIVENFSMGLQNAEAHKVEKEVLEGFKMVLQQFKQCFKEFSLEAIEPVNTSFDPRLHEAVSAIHDANTAEGSILKLIRTGYRIGERVVRPASVIVSKGPETTTPENAPKQA